MSSAISTDIAPRRIVVTFESRPLPMNAAEAAAGMAARLQAELVGLVIEDIQLLHFAALPFAREVGRVSAHSRELDVATMERSFRSMAADAERWLAAAAARMPMQWSLRVARGLRIQQIVAAAADADLIVSGNTVVLLCSDKAHAEEWEPEARAALQRPDRSGTLRLLRAADAAELEKLLREAG